MAINNKDQLFDNRIEDTDWLSLVENEWELLTGVLLDTQIPLERLKIVLYNLKKDNILDYRELSKWNKKQIAKLLKDSGYIWYNSKARYFGQTIKFNLKTATYDQMITIKGIGPKLASMWMRIVHNEDRVIIDTHVKKWLAERGHKSNSYEELSKAFRKEAEKLNMLVDELDRQIVRDGILKRRGLR